MKLFLDTADFDEIKQGVDWGVVDGVTTNPTLIAKAGQDHETQVKKICGIIGNVSAEVVSEKKDDILVEGRRLASWHKNVIVKVPLTPDGLAAGKILAGEGTRINVTLCFSVNQALLAAATGAYIISPFVGRIDDNNEDGMQIVGDIVSAYRQQDIKTKVLAGSLRGPLHVTQSALAGADIGTMPFRVLAAMFKHPLTGGTTVRSRNMLSRWFDRLSKLFNELTASPWALAATLILVVGYFFAAPRLGLAEQRVDLGFLIALITVILVFVLEYQGYRERAGIQVKLDELLRALIDADSSKIGVEELHADEIAQLREIGREEGRKTRAG